MPLTIPLGRRVGAARPPFSPRRAKVKKPPPSGVVNKQVGRHFTLRYGLLRALLFFSFATVSCGFYLIPPGLNPFLGDKDPHFIGALLLFFSLCKNPFSPRRDAATAPLMVPWIFFLLITVSDFPVFFPFP